MSSEEGVRDSGINPLSIRPANDNLVIINNLTNALTSDEYLVDRFLIALKKCGWEFVGIVANSPEFKELKVINHNHGYFSINGITYYQGEIVEGVDSDSFRSINGHYFVDDSFVYFQGKKLNERSSNDFRSNAHLIGHFYILDKKLYLGDEEQTDVCILDRIGPDNSQRGPNGNYIFEKNGKKYLANFNVIIDELIGKGDSKIYIIKTPDKIIIDGNHIKGVDVNSFQYYGKGRFKDKNHLYYFGEVKGASTEECKLTNPDFIDFSSVDNISKLRPLAEKFAITIDKALIAFCKYKGLSCTPLTPSSYFLIEGSVYYLVEMVKDADAHTFHLINGNYAKDQNGIYFRSQKVLEIEEDEEILYGAFSYLITTKYVYYGTKRLAKINHKKYNNFGNSRSEGIHTDIKNKKTYIVDAGMIIEVDCTVSLPNKLVLGNDLYIEGELQVSVKK